MGALSDFRRRLEDEKEYGLPTYIDRTPALPKPVTPIVLPPVQEFVSEVPTTAVAEAVPPEEFDLDAPESVEAPPEPPSEPAEPKLIESLKADGYKVEIWIEGKSFRGTVLFCGGRVMSVFAETEQACRSAANTLGNQNLSIEDLALDSGETTPSNREPSKDFRHGQ